MQLKWQLNRQWKMPRGNKVYVLIAVLIICVVGGYVLLAGNSKPKTEAEPIPLVRTQVVQPQGAVQNYDYAGEVRGRYESKLAFQVGGKVIKRYVEVGSAVKRGDVLMEVDSSNLQLGVARTDSQVASAQADLRLAQTNLARYEELYANHAISKSELDRMSNAYQVSQARLQEILAQQGEALNQLSHSTLMADNDGVIAEIKVESGQVVNAGQEVVTLVQDNEKEVEINIPEQRLAEIEAAKQVKVSFWAFPNIVLDGMVREISPQADKVTRTYKVRITLINPPDKIRLGMTANVKVITDESLKMFIPLAAIYQADNTPTVWVVNQGVVEQRPVKLGAFGDNVVEVMEGLVPGEVIVTAGVHKLMDGQKVRLGEGGIK